MSGPKVDVAELRRQELERINEARRGRQRLAAEIERAIRRMQQKCGDTCALLDQDSSMTEKAKEIRAEYAALEKKLRALQRRVRAGNELFDTAQAEAEFRSLMQEISPEQHTADIERLIAQNESLQRIRQESEAISRTKRHILTVIAESDPAEDAQRSEAELRTQSETFEEAIRSFMQTGEMTGAHKNSVLLISQELHELMERTLPAETKSKRIRRLYGEYEKLGALIRTEMETMRAIYEEYCSECFDSDLPAAALTDFSSKKELLDALETVREKAKCRLSQEYIRRQIDEVMAKHGYSVVRSDLLAEANAAGQVLYGVNDDTAINVFVSDENQVTMRVVGIGFDTDISDAEDEKLYQEQCAFCSMHPQITAELAMRGVILKTKKHHAPDRKFNKKIITRSRSDTQSGSRARKDLKRQTLKTMHKE